MCTCTYYNNKWLSVFRKLFLDNIPKERYCLQHRIHTVSTFFYQYNYGGTGKITKIPGIYRRACLYLFLIPTFSKKKKKKNFLLLIVNGLEAILAFIGNLRFIVANEKNPIKFVLQIILKDINLCIH